MTDLLLTTLPGLIAADGTPNDNDVVAGPLGFVIFAALLVAVALLGWSLSKHLKKVHKAADDGVFGESEADQDAGGTKA